MRRARCRAHRAPLGRGRTWRPRPARSRSGARAVSSPPGRRGRDRRPYRGPLDAAAGTTSICTGSANGSPGSRRRPGTWPGRGRGRWPAPSSRRSRPATRAIVDDAVRRATGRGPGLTPSGDDVLAGILAVLTAPGSRLAASRSRTVFALRLLLVLPTTTEISRALLVPGIPRPREPPSLGAREQRAIGQPSCRPPHRPGPTCSRTGATSGGDTCAGLAAACRLLSRSLEGIEA